MADEQQLADPQPWRGAPGLEALLVPIDEVELDPRNARRHPQANLESIATSLLKFGQLKPIVCKGKRIVAGNGTWTALKALEWTHIARVPVPEDMTDAEAVAFAIADNKTSDLAEWDFQELAALIREIPEDLREFTGFRDFEIEPMLQGEWKPPAVADPSAGAGTATVHAVFTTEQYGVCERALEELRKREEDESMTFGRAMELICADFLAG